MLTLPIRRPRADVRKELASLVVATGPFLSVYLDVTPGERRESSGERLSEKLRQLPSVGSEAQTGAVAGLLDDIGDDDAALVLLVSADGTQVKSSYPDPPGGDLVELSALPYVAPLLAAEQSLTHHVIASVGIDTLSIMVVPRHGKPSLDEHSYADSAACIALIQMASRAAETKLLVVGADEQILADLEPAIRSGLPMDISLDAIATNSMSSAEFSAAIVRATSNHAATKIVELLRLWRFHQSHGETASGVLESLSALAARSAALVLFHDDPTDERQAWFGDAPDRVAPDIEHATPIDRGELLAHARLSDVVLRAALATGCAVQIVPSVDATLPEGIGVILNDVASTEAMAALLER